MKPVYTEHVDSLRLEKWILYRYAFSPIPANKNYGLLAERRLINKDR